MRFRLHQRFPAPLATVEEAIVDPGFLQYVGQIPELGSPQLLERWVEDHLLHHRVRYRFAGQLSGAVTSVVDPDRLTWVEELTLDRRTHHGQHRIVPDHYGNRLRCSYTTQLRPESDHGAERLAEGVLEVRFPLVGAKVERAIVSGLVERAELEAVTLARWLQEQG